VPMVGSLLVPRASVRFSPKYLIAVTPVYYLLIVLGLSVLKKESRVLFWVCVIALVGISLYSLGDYYLRQHDKLAQAQHSLAKVSEPLLSWSLCAEDTLCQESRHVFEVTRREVANILGSVRVVRMRSDLGMVRSVISPRDECGSMPHAILFRVCERVVWR